jgi:hypothetical protein
MLRGRSRTLSRRAMVAVDRGGPNALVTLQARRHAERRRFGASVNVILAGGLVGVGVLVRWYGQQRPDSWESPGRASSSVQPLAPTAIVAEQREVEALLDDVRVVLARFGVSLGKVPLRVKLLSADHSLEGMTTKVIRPPPLLRGVEALSLRRNLTALSAAQTLAHEYTHAWLWLQGFPALDTRLEEGLCELLSYLYLLSCLREPSAPGDGSVLVRDAAAREHIAQQLIRIEANAHPDYGGGFRDCVEALKGRSLHELLGYVREHAVLPPSAILNSRPSGGQGQAAALGDAQSAPGSNPDAEAI